MLPSTFLSTYQPTRLGLKKIGILFLLSATTANWVLGYNFDHGYEVALTNFEHRKAPSLPCPHDALIPSFPVFALRPGSLEVPIGGVGHDNEEACPRLGVARPLGARARIVAAGRVLEGRREGGL